MGDVGCSEYDPLVRDQPADRLVLHRLHRLPQATEVVTGQLQGYPSSIEVGNLTNSGGAAAITAIEEIYPDISNSGKVR